MKVSNVIDYGFYKYRSQQCPKCGIIGAHVCLGEIKGCLRDVEHPILGVQCNCSKCSPTVDTYA